MSSQQKKSTKTEVDIQGQKQKLSYSDPKKNETSSNNKPKENPRSSIKKNEENDLKSEIDLVNKNSLVMFYDKPTQKFKLIKGTNYKFFPKGNTEVSTVIKELEKEANMPYYIPNIYGYISIGIGTFLLIIFLILLVTKVVLALSIIVGVLAIMLLGYGITQVAINQYYEKKLTNHFNKMKDVFMIRLSKFDIGVKLQLKKVHFLEFYHKKEQNQIYDQFRRSNVSNVSNMSENYRSRNKIDRKSRGRDDTKDASDIVSDRRSLNNSFASGGAISDRSYGDRRSRRRRNQRKYSADNMRDEESRGSPKKVRTKVSEASPRKEESLVRSEQPSEYDSYRSYASYENGNRRPTPRKNTRHQQRRRRKERLEIIKEQPSDQKSSPQFIDPELREDSYTSQLNSQRDRKTYIRRKRSASHSRSRRNSANKHSVDISRSNYLSFGDRVGEESYYNSRPFSNIDHYESKYDSIVPGMQEYDFTCINDYQAIDEERSRKDLRRYQKENVAPRNYGYEYRDNRNYHVQRINDPKDVQIHIPKRKEIHEVLNNVVINREGKSDQYRSKQDTRSLYQTNPRDLNGRIPLEVNNGIVRSSSKSKISIVNSGYKIREQAGPLPLIKKAGENSRSKSKERQGNYFIKRASIN